MADVLSPTSGSRPSRFGYAYALVNEIQAGQGMPLCLAVEALGRIAANTHNRNRNDALQALRDVRKAQDRG